MSDPHTPPREDGLTIYATESGHVAHVQAGALVVTIEGCADEEEAAAAAVATLDALAARRGKRPSKVADRTAAKLRDALRQP